MFFRGQTLGKYRILSSIGSGGFGTVYLAEDTWIDKKVALKVPHKQHLPFNEMLKEARLLAAMSHPNIVSVLTAEKEDEHFFIVMEYVQGQTLEQLIIREGALDLARHFAAAFEVQPMVLGVPDSPDLPLPELDVGPHRASRVFRRRIAKRRSSSTSAGRAAAS